MDNKYTRTTELITPKISGKYTSSIWDIASTSHTCQILDCIWYFFQSITIFCKNYMIELSNILAQEKKPKI